MKPFTKRTRLFATLGVAALLGVVVTTWNSGRMPARPAPPGVTAPEGMRYVGGDEFDDPSRALVFADMTVNTATPTKRPAGRTPLDAKVATSVVRTPPSRLRDGKLENRTAPGTENDTENFLQIASATVAEHVLLRKRGRMEIRLRHTGSGAVSAFFSPGGFTLFDLGPNRNPVDPLFGTAALPGFDPRLHAHPATDDGAFHVFVVEWTPDSLRFLQDGAETGRCDRAQKNSPLTAPVLPVGWIYKLGFLSLLEWKSWTPAHSEAKIGFTLSAPAGAAAKPTMDIDYVRIFQE